VATGILVVPEEAFRMTSAHFIRYHQRRIRRHALAYHAIRTGPELPSGTNRPGSDRTQKQVGRRWKGPPGKPNSGANLNGF